MRERKTVIKAGLLCIAALLLSLSPVLWGRQLATTNWIVLVSASILLILVIVYVFVDLRSRPRSEQEADAESQQHIKPAVFASLIVGIVIVHVVFFIVMRQGDAAGAGREKFLLLAVASAWLTGGALIWYALRRSRQ